MTAWSALAELSHPGDSIRERRTELGWTQAELSKRSGVPQADISRIENGRLDARWSTIQRISAALADTSARPRRSLANGRKITSTAAWTEDDDPWVVAAAETIASTPAPSTKKWSPRGAVLKIGRAER